MNSGIIQNPNVEIELRRQRTRSTISSLLISLLVIVLAGVVLMFWLIPGLSLMQPDVIAYQSASNTDDKVEVKELNPSVQRKPSAPSSSMAKVIAANTTSPTAIPVPDFASPVESLDFGDGDDFGSGWGSGGEGGGGGGGATFFGSTSKVNRVAFVIDYSGSMAQDDRVGIMKKELDRSVADLAAGTKFQMIFFAGPVWVAGGEVLLKGEDAKKGNKIKGVDGKTYEWVTTGGAHGFKPKGKMEVATWLEVPSGSGLIGSQKREAVAKGKGLINKSRKIIAETPLVWGTRWKYALEMALDMNPTPEVIYFMTDGATGDEAMKVARTVGAQAKSRGITINCIAMMEPKAHDAMKEIAKRTGGEFTVVDKGGKHRKVPLD